MIKFTVLVIDIRRATSEWLSLQYLIFILEHLMYLQSLKDKGQDPYGIKDNLHVSIQRKTTTG
jgi:hypothetical protein